MRLVRNHFHGMPDIPWGWLLLQAPELRFGGLAAPPEDSLNVPRDGELLVPAPGPPKFTCAGPDNCSIWFVGLGSFRPSARKLPTITCNNRKKRVSVQERELSLKGNVLDESIKSNGIAKDASKQIAVVTDLQKRISIT